MKSIGLIVNPIAGMGGSVGLKGTDGKTYKKAIELGAQPTTPERIKKTLALVNRKDLYFITAPGKMGEDYIKKFDFKYEVISKIEAETNADDTKRIIREMLVKGIDLLIFVGGDGTARDVYDVLGLTIPVVGIPSGVKMFSPVFALSTFAAAEIINNKTDELIEKEVLDIDEEAFRNGKLAAKLYGYLKVPKNPSLLQGKKEPSNITKPEKISKEEISQYIFENIETDTLYILGPGTTLKTIADKIGVEKSLLGIDAVFNKKLIGKDLNEKGLLELIKKYKKNKIILTPIGGNGFILGRASKQFTPEVIKLIGKENLIVVATEDKISRLECLRVDTGDVKVDEGLKGHCKVITGYKSETLIDVK
ncbi:ATP-NAD kinase family protein [Ancylomarina sp. 16SWW S1-10-2]|uniref:ATP-NAD kinase family protein n=1 Tax=Ancylomarina sp. 16SWW S1-10-2 TaxID=2499681 RepID=UPI0012AD9225|nr:ATP-NAD kinase family protein [Ancylomarina sp. 16SWW S1-10-2]MRT92513.1 ATP-NAD kinase [Ancylomarina sp. 16SWW S1-10-2]